jgi:peptidyl-prolyl cis-trans isomerase C
MRCEIRTGLAAGAPQPVSVNGVVIAREAIAAEMQHHPAPRPIEAWQAAARALAVRELLLQEARRLDIAAVPLSDAAGRRETEEEALIRALIAQEIATPQPNPEECRRYYDRNRHRFRSAALYEAAHILYAASAADAAAYARARARATAAIALLQEQPHRFAALARAESDCPSGRDGGHLGQISAGQTTPEFERALMALAPGALAPEPVGTRYGFHVIRLDARSEGRELPFDLVAARIAEYLAESVRRRAIAQYIARLVSRARITGIVLADAQAHRVS